MSNNSENNKRIAKNTMVLYVRMLFNLLVSLYTSRVILNTLGIEDYGIYNVVGGLVSIFASVQGAIGEVTLRFLTIEIEKNNTLEIHKKFVNSLFVHCLTGALLVLVCELLGSWFLTVQMNIPEDKIIEATWVFHSTQMMLFLSCVNIPYSVMIIAHEKMNTYAVITMIDAAVKLFIAISLSLFISNKLTAYALLMLGGMYLNHLIYVTYCKIKYRLVLFDFKQLSVPLLRIYFTLTGYTFIGNFSYSLFTQGVNVLLNLFFGPVVNAARGIAVQVQSFVLLLSSNIQQAINPQIIKSYVRGDVSYTRALICANSKYSFFLIFVLALPVFLEAKGLLTLWLGNVPENTVTFVRIMLCISIVSSMSAVFDTASFAVGNIKKYQIFIGGVNLFILPVSYVALLIWQIPAVVFIVTLLILALGLFIRLCIMKSGINLSWQVYSLKVLYPALKVLMASVIFPSLVYMFLPFTLMRAGLILTVSLVATIASIYMLGLDKDEKAWIAVKVRTYIKQRNLW